MEKSLRPRVYLAQDAALDPNTKPDGYLQKIVKYIPTEIVAAYVVLFKLSDKPELNLIIFLILLVITPLYTWYFTQQSGLTRPIYQTIVAPIAFAVWVLALGGKGNPFEKIDMVEANPMIGSIVLILATLCIPLIERIVTKNPA